VLAMKLSILKGCVIAAYGVCSLFAHAQQWSDYKCYVLDTEGGQWVHLFEMDPQNLSMELAALPGRLILDSFGRTVAEVQEVKECVSLDASFSSLKARTLDDKTPK
jgi:diaminopimelate decarboxylase